MNLKKSLAIGSAIALQGIFLSAHGTPANDNAIKKDRTSPRFVLNLTGISYHTITRGFDDNGSFRKYNEINPGFGLEYHLSDHFHVIAGTYKNSVYKQSFYAAAGYEAFPHKKFGLGGEIGLITGYKERGPIIPIALPYVRIGKKDALVGAKLGIIPTKHPVFTLQGRINLSKLIKKIAPSPRP